MFEKKVYVGDRVVSGESLFEDGYVEVLFSDNSKEVFGKEILEILKSDKSIDESALREEKIHFVAKEILTLLLKHNVKPSEFEFLTSVLQGSMNENIKRANDKLWGKPAAERTMLDLEKVLK